LEFPETVNIDRIFGGVTWINNLADRLATDYRIEVATGSNNWHVVASSIDRQPYVPGAKEKAAV